MKGNRLRHSIPSGALVFVILVGCRAAERMEPAAGHSASLVVQADEADRLWNAAELTLRSLRYPIDRLDRRNGVISTLPQISQHWFEFWRKDVATANDWADATLNPVRRWVEIRLTSETPTPERESATIDGGANQSGLTERPAGENGLGPPASVPVPVALSVFVHRERFSAPERQFNNSGAAFQAFATSLPATTSAVRDSAPAERWITAGRDTAMETRLQSAIEDRFRAMD